MKINKEQLMPFVSFKTSRSGGKGGQHVNKVSTKAELNFDLQNSNLFNDEQKGILLAKLDNKKTSEGLIQVISDEERSQLLNKERAIEKLIRILESSLYVPKQRKATKPKKSAIENRLKEKQMKAMKKLNRKKDW